MKRIGYISLLFFIILCSCTDNISKTTVNYNNKIPRSQSKSAKRGVCYSFQLADVDAALLNPGISWFYNWGSDVSDKLSGLITLYNFDYFPMIWNGNFDADRIRTYKAEHPECEYILGFNEPNLTSQANMTPSEAAASWRKIEALAKELDMKLVSPAMNYGTMEGYSDPITWLDEFFTYVPIDSISAIAVHCYMSNAGALKAYIKKFKKYGKPIWLTEFCGWEAGITNVTKQIDYMSEAIAYLETDTCVKRYAWFIPRTAAATDSYPYMQLLTKTSPYTLTDLGRVFIDMSTFDQTVYSKVGDTIQAEHFTNSNASDHENTDDWGNMVHIHPTTDSVGGNLEVTDFSNEEWLEYHIETPKTADYIFTIRYTDYVNSTVSISIDNKETTSMALTKTGNIDQWETLSTTIHISKGKHTIRLIPTQGIFYFNWISFSDSK